MTSYVRSKVTLLIFAIVGFAGQGCRSIMKQDLMKQLGLYLDIFKHPPKILEISCQVEVTPSHGVKTGHNAIFGFGWHYKGF